LVLIFYSILIVASAKLKLETTEEEKEYFCELTGKTSKQKQNDKMQSRIEMVYFFYLIFLKGILVVGEVLSKKKLVWDNQQVPITLIFG